MIDPATKTTDHTLAHLARLDLLIRREVVYQRRRRPSQGDDDFRGLYLSERDVDGLLDGPLIRSSLLSPPRPEGDEVAALDGAIAALDRRIADLETGVGDEDAGAPLLRLGRIFGLSRFERHALLLCLAAELDLKYERLYSYLQDDVTKKRPTVELAIRLLCPDLADRLAARRSFAPGAPLLRWELLSLNDDPGARRPVLLSRYLKLDDRIAAFLLGEDGIDERLRPLTAPDPDGRAAPSVRPDPALEIGSIPVETRGRLERWADAWAESWPVGAVPPVILIGGRYGAGKRAAAVQLARLLDRPILLLDATALAAAELGPGRAQVLAERETRLRQGLLAWSDADRLLDGPPETEGERLAFRRALRRGSVPTLLLTEKPWEAVRELGDRPFLAIEIPEVSYAERREAWRARLTEAGALLSDAELSALAGRYRLSPGQIGDAARRARTLAWARDPFDGRPVAADVDAACRAQARGLNTLARKLSPRYTWEDIVLPRPQLATLRLIGATVRKRPQVYGDWGFDRKLSQGKGLVALFAGPSGTGKTMAAEVLANDLRLDLYKIDLSSVVSKYIGETEKNLERIFREAREGDAILFFDEADALFGKRSEVRDAHDRYANIETAYLLQRTEEYEGLVILASNLKKNLDDAFIRRLHFILDFPMPEEPERLEIWKRTFPPETPRAADLDLAFLARKLKIAGGNIRNVVLTAAFLAAEDGQPVGMPHLVRAAGYELQKMGKLLVEGDFEQYFGMIRM